MDVLKPKLVSFTGADNEISALELLNLTENNPEFYLEWALLYYLEAEGTLRNPDKRKRDEFLNSGLNCAVHLCGKTVFEKILNFDQSIIQELKSYSRVQININSRNEGFSDEAVIAIYDILSSENISLILQYHEKSKFLIDTYIQHRGLEQKSILIDASKGRGVAPKEWLAPIGNFCGYAGGLNASNIKEHTLTISKLCQRDNKNYWLDMETGLRFNNHFQLQYCQKVLTALK